MLAHRDCFWAALVAGAMLLQGGVQAAPVTVVENPEQFEFFGELWRSYDVYNNSDVEGPSINVLAVVVTNDMPATEFLRWTAYDLYSEADWDASMDSALGTGLSWRDFFGGAAFPGPANGYFLEYSVDNGLLTFGDDPIGPGGASLGEFWFAGPLSSEFLVAAASTSTPLDGFDPDGISVLRGTAVIPEPAAIAIGCLALTVLPVSRRLRR